MGVQSREAADALARACAAAMWPDDNATNHLGMQLFDVSQGCASMRMTVGPHMANGHGICHGGYIFLLADSAFAYACNTYDHRTVAQQAAIAFIHSGKVGDVLTARAREVSKSGRSGIYDITVTRQDGAVIAEFRGHSRVIKGHILGPQS
jgi:acyl-CoA thioesterase